MVLVSPVADTKTLLPSAETAIAVHSAKGALLITQSAPAFVDYVIGEIKGLFAGHKFALRVSYAPGQRLSWGSKRRGRGKPGAFVAWINEPALLGFLTVRLRMNSLRRKRSGKTRYSINERSFAPSIHWSLLTKDLGRPWKRSPEIFHSDSLSLNHS
jgi:hypothetical protein